MRGKIYITDEGFGPIVRQSAIIEELRRLNPEIHFTLQTSRHLTEARRIIRGISYIERYNNITWDKTEDGSPDHSGIRKSFADYMIRSDDFIENELADFNYQFIISDFVYEGFEAAHRKSVPSFGVAHFTWDWFFSKLYPCPVPHEVLDRFFSFAELAEVIYFPPFTPGEILRHYKHKAKQVPLIVRKHISRLPDENTDRFRVLIMDSGSGVLGEQIKKALLRVGAMDDFYFYVSSDFENGFQNVTTIDRNSLFIDYIPKMDLVIGRAGFNTISECIAYRTPMLLISEAMNPEMSENMVNIKHEGLGSFISIEQFTQRLDHYLPKFVSHEYRLIHENMKSHDIGDEGAVIVAKDILGRIAG